jgi:hypothetical protein
VPEKSKRSNSLFNNHLRPMASIWQFAIMTDWQIELAKPPRANPLYRKTPFLPQNRLFFPRP